MTNDQMKERIREILKRKTELQQVLTKGAGQLLQNGVTPEPLDMETYSAAIKEEAILDQELTKLQNEGR